MEEYKILKFIKLVCPILLAFEAPSVFGSEDSDSGYSNEGKSLLSGPQHLQPSSDEKIISFADEARKLRLRQEGLEQRKKTSIETESLTREVLDRQVDQAYDEFTLEDKQRSEALKIKKEENMLELKKVSETLRKIGNPSNERLPLINRENNSDDFYTQIIKGFKSASWTTLTAVASCCCAVPLIVWYYYDKKKV